MIVEWLFPMHTAEMLAHLHRTERAQAPAKILTTREAENLFATQRCAATRHMCDQKLVGKARFSHDAVANTLQTPEITACSTSIGEASA
jgi:hypothetical protein